MYPWDNRGHLLTRLPVVTHEAADILKQGDFVKFDPTDSNKMRVIKAASLEESIGYYFDDWRRDAGKGCLVAIAYLNNGNLVGSTLNNLGNCCNIELQGPVSEICYESSSTFGPEQLLIQSEVFTSPSAFDAYNPGTRRFYQSFTFNQDFKLTKLEYQLKKQGSPTGSVTIDVYEDNAGEPGTLQDQSDSLNVPTLTTSFTDMTEFLFPSEPLIETNLATTIFGFTPNFSDIATFNSTNHVQTWRSQNAAYADGQIFESNDGGSTWNPQNRDHRFNVYGRLGGGVTATNLVIKSDLWLSVPGLSNNANVILAQTLNLPNPTDVAYVIANSTNTPMNLPVIVDDIANVDQANPLIFIIARRVGNKIEVGYNSLVSLNVDECGYLNQQSLTPAQEIEEHVITYVTGEEGSDKTINTDFTKVVDVIIRDEFNNKKLNMHYEVNGTDVIICSKVLGTYSITIEGYK